MADIASYLCKPAALPEFTPIRFPLSDIDHLCLAYMIPSFYIYPFATDSTSARQAAVFTFKSALEKTAGHIPIQLGRVYNTGTRSYVYRSDAHDGIPCFTNGVTKPLTTIHSYNNLKANNFHPADLPIADLLPLSDLELTTLSGDDEPSAPTCLIQLTFIAGGVILAYVMNHIVSDMHSTDLFLRAVAAYARSEFTRVPELHFDRHFLNADAGRKQPLEKAAHDQVEELLFREVCPPKKRKSKQPNNLVLAFSVQKCQELKVRVNDADVNVAVSTLDCLSSTLWRCITRAKIAVSGSQDESTSELLYAVGLPDTSRGGIIPPGYFGNAVCRPGVPLSVAKLIAADTLPETARALRTQIRRLDGSMVHDLVQYTGAHWNDRSMSTATVSPNGLDLIITSWSCMGCYREYDFGWGLPEAMRVPAASVHEFAVVFPRKGFADGGQVMEVWMALEEDVVARLQEDEELKALLHDTRSRKILVYKAGHECV